MHFKVECIFPAVGKFLPAKDSLMKKQASIVNVINMFRLGMGKGIFSL